MLWCCWLSTWNASDMQVLLQHFLKVWLGSPSPPIVVIWAVMIVWRIRRKIIRTVQCCTVCHNYTVISTHIWAVLTGVLSPADVYFRVFLWVFLPRAGFFILCFWCIFSRLFWVVIIPVQVIAWKDSSTKWPTMCRWDVKLWRNWPVKTKIETSSKIRFHSLNQKTKVQETSKIHVALLVGFMVLFWHWIFKLLHIIISDGINS